MRKNLTAALVVALAASSAAAQTRVNVDKPRVNVGDVDSKSKSRANQNVTGLDADVYFEASDIPNRTNNTVKSVPDVVPPSIVGGNPCMISASIGGSGVGFGFGVGVGVEDEGCETRQVVALMSNMGDRQAAFLHLCLHNSQVADTVKAAGFGSCQDYAGIVTPGPARVAAVTASVPVQGTVAASRPAVIPAARPAATSMTLAANCSNEEYRGLLRSGAAWSAYSPACQARHEAN